MVVLLVHHVAHAVALVSHNSHHHLLAVRARILGCALTVREQHFLEQYLKNVWDEETVNSFLRFLLHRLTCLER